MCLWEARLSVTGLALDELVGNSKTSKLQGLENKLHLSTTMWPVWPQQDHLIALRCNFLICKVGACLDALQGFLWLRHPAPSGSEKGAQRTTQKPLTSGYCCQKSPSHSPSLFSDGLALHYLVVDAACFPTEPCGIGQQSTGRADRKGGREWESNGTASPAFPKCCFLGLQAEGGCPLHWGPEGQQTPNVPTLRNLCFW